MKLFIQIPCYNEAATIARTLKDLPRHVEGFESVQWLIIDDGCTDETVAIAREYGIDHVVRLTKHLGLAKGFMAGLDACLKLGADVIVNTDGDNQYKGTYIPKIVAPILAGEADMVVGVRPIKQIDHFSRLKKWLQRFGSWVVRVASNTDVSDVTSGFRAISRDAAMQLNVFSQYTYTLETVIQAGQKNLAVVSIPIEINEELRPSRLLKSVFNYVQRSIGTIIRIFVVYQPFRFFLTIGSLLFAAGMLIGIRFLYFYFAEGGGGHIQSLILASILLGIGLQTILVAFLSDLQSVNRRLLEDIQYRIKKIDCGDFHKGSRKFLGSKPEEEQ